jgi:hypothetical protein
MTRKQRKALRRAKWRKLHAKRRGKKVARKSVRRYSRKARDSKGRFLRKGRRAVRRTGRRSVRRSAKRKSTWIPHSVYTGFREAMTPGGDYFGMGVNPRRRGRKSRRRNPGVKHFKDGSMMSYQDDGYVTLVSKNGAERHYEMSARDFSRFLGRAHKAQGFKSAERLMPRGAVLRQVNPHGVGRKSASAMKRVLRAHGYKCNPRRRRARRNCGY